MEPSEATKLSKLLSYILRHGAIKEKLQLRDDGYVPVSDVLALPKFKKYTREQIEHVVRSNDKQRYKLEVIDNECMIRANQGHTIKVNQEQLLERIAAPLPTVIHGTSLRSWQLIKEQGLSRMRRHHIHCATGLPGDSGVISGMRSSSQVYIYIDMAKAMEDGIVFYRSSNHVILTEGQNGALPVKYFDKVVDCQGNSL